MKLKELIEWLQKLDPEYDILIDDIDMGHKEISGIEPYDANREYVIW